MNWTIGVQQDTFKYTRTLPWSPWSNRIPFGSEVIVWAWDPAVRIYNTCKWIDESLEDYSGRSIMSFSWINKLWWDYITSFVVNGGVSSPMEPEAVFRVRPISTSSRHVLVKTKRLQTRILMKGKFLLQFSYLHWLCNKDNAMCPCFTCSPSKKKLLLTESRFPLAWIVTRPCKGWGWPDGDDDDEVCSVSWKLERLRGLGRISKFKGISVDDPLANRNLCEMMWMWIK
jgi:hypothetical protein